jgi:GT2 family glycosyltransferase
LLDRCLRTVSEAETDLRLEIIVVDNASTDGTGGMVTRKYPEVRYILNQSNRGFAEANNQGIEVSSGRYILLLNSDTEIRPGALQALVRYMDENPAMGACGPRLRYPDGSVQRSIFSFETPGRVVADMLALGRLLPGTRLENLNSRFDYAKPGEVDWLIAAAVLVRREVVEEVGMLDPRFRLHCNDSDWCLRIRKAGYGISYVPESEIVHHSGATLGAERERHDVDSEMLRNLFDYHRKYYGEWGVRWLRLWMVIGYAARYVLGRIRPAAASATPLDRRLRAAWTGRP